MARLHGIFGSEKILSYSDTGFDAYPFKPKHLTYEVFGPPGTTADISYIDVNADPHLIRGASLPWSLEMATTSAGIFGNILTQSDGDSIGCRIVVDGVVKAENSANQEQAFTSCLVKPA